MADVRHSPDWYANSDVDWFCRINGINIHVASMGRQLPEGVEETLPKLYEQVSEIKMAEWRDGEGVWYNEKLLRTWLGMEEPQRMARYLYTFVVMARKGFYSFAPITPDVTDGDYYLMAKPKNYHDWALDDVLNKGLEFFNINDVKAFASVPIVELMNFNPQKQG